MPLTAQEEIQKKSIEEIDVGKFKFVHYPIPLREISLVEAKSKIEEVKWVGKTEVTQLQWESITGLDFRDWIINKEKNFEVDSSAPDEEMRDELPAFAIDFFEAIAFMKKFNQLHRKSLNKMGVKARLPTKHEYEWMEKKISETNEADGGSKLIEGMNNRHSEWCLDFFLDNPELQNGEGYVERVLMGVGHRKEGRLQSFLSIVTVGIRIVLEDDAQ